MSKKEKQKENYEGEIDKFPEIYNLPRMMSHEEIKNLD